MAKSPRKLDNGDFTLTQTEAAILAGVSVQTLINWKKKQNPPPTNDDATHSAREFGKWLQNRAKPAPSPTVAIDGDSRSAVETRLKLAQAIKAERENDVEAGKLIDVEEAVTAWQSILSRVRTRILEFPHSLAPLLAGDDDPFSVQSKLKDAVNDALSELSEDWSDDEDSDGSD